MKISPSFYRLAHLKMRVIRKEIARIRNEQKDDAAKSGMSNEDIKVLKKVLENVPTSILLGSWP